MKSPNIPHVDERVLKEFNKRNINYCLLRNYTNITKNEDLDILVDSKDGRKVKQILKKFGLVTRIWGFGPFLISNKRFDIKIGCTEYGGCYIEGAKSVLARKRAYTYFYILGKEDELEHLILKSMGNKCTKAAYLKTIARLMKECDLHNVQKRFALFFGRVGKEVFSLMQKKEYQKALQLREALYAQRNSLYNKVKYILYRITFPCLKR